MTKNVSLVKSRDRKRSDKTVLLFCTACSYFTGTIFVSPDCADIWLQLYGL